MGLNFITIEKLTKKFRYNNFFFNQNLLVQYLQKLLTLTFFLFGSVFSFGCSTMERKVYFIEFLEYDPVKTSVELFAECQ